jgi:hypothetical protein
MADVAVRGDEDPLSPTTMVFKYLQSKGLQPNAQNVRAAVMQMGRQPDEAGPDPIPGLRVERQDNQSDASSRGGSVANKVEPQGNQGNAGSTGSAGGRDDTSNGTSSKTTSAQPSDNVGQGGPVDPLSGSGGVGPLLGGIIATGLPLGAVGYGAYKALTGGGMAAGGGGAPTVDIAGALPAPPLQLGGPPSPPEAPMAVPGSTIPMPDQSVSPMEAAMQKAIAPPGSPLQLGYSGGNAPPIALPDQSSGPAIPMPPPDRPASVGGAAATPQPRPSVTIDTNPQLSGGPSPINPQMIRPGQPGVTIQTNPRLSGRPPPIEFGNLRGLGRFIR